MGKAALERRAKGDTFCLTYGSVSLLCLYSAQRPWDSSRTGGKTLRFWSTSIKAEFSNGGAIQSCH